MCRIGHIPRVSEPPPGLRPSLFARYTRILHCQLSCAETGAPRPSTTGARMEDTLATPPPSRCSRASLQANRYRPVDSARLSPAAPRSPLAHLAASSLQASLRGHQVDKVSHMATMDQLQQPPESFARSRLSVCGPILSVCAAGFRPAPPGPPQRCPTPVWRVPTRERALRYRRQRVSPTPPAAVVRRAASGV